MNTVIFRTLVPVLVLIMLVFAVYVLLRGHNEPGGGFVGGLIAASALSVLAMARGAAYSRRAMRFDPLALAGFGVGLAVLSGIASLFAEKPFLTGLWTSLDLGETVVSLSTPMLFDIGVFLTVFGTFAGVALALQDTEEER